MRGLLMSTMALAAAAGSSDPTVTTKTFTVPMTAFFKFGVPRGHTRNVSSGKVALCPKAGKQFCIDKSMSDAATCLYPDPTTIKQCLDESCHAMPENEKIYAKYGDDSYCKEYMNTVEGRLCHWSSTPCTCPQYDLTYVDALIIDSTTPIPTGWHEVKECEYPIDYKAENRRANRGDSVAEKRKPVPKFNNQPGNSAELSIITNPTAIVSLIAVVTLLPFRH